MSKGNIYERGTNIQPPAKAWGNFFQDPPAADSPVLKRDHAHPCLSGIWQEY